MRYFTILLEPSGKKVEAQEGETFLETFHSAKVWIRSDCGGRGICGRCRIHFLHGAPPPTSAEKRVFSEAEIKIGWRLACQHKIASDAQIWVPPLEIVSPEKTRTPPYILPLNPLASLERIAVSPPLKEKEQSDLERLEESLGENLEFSLSFLEELPEALRVGDYKISLIRVGKKAVSIRPGWEKLNIYGLAVDVGTSTLAAYLLNLESGEEVGAEAIANPQASFGADVLTRIAYVQKQGKKALVSLREAVVNGVNHLVQKLAAKAVVEVRDIIHLAVVGNPTMLHFFLGVDPSSIGVSPFVPVWKQPLSFKARDLGLAVCPEAVVQILPFVSGYVGADTVGCILACRMHQSERPCLLLDLGTNAEIVLATEGKLFACSAAAGPAFEGGKISCGMPAVEGAISHVTFDGQIHFQVIGDVIPKGICGSGLVDLLAVLLEAGLLDKTGRFQRGKHPLASRIIGSNNMIFPVTESIAITQKDIREVQLAKAAIRAGVEVLLEHAELIPQQIEKVYLAGAFGSQMCPESLVKIGLIPKEFLLKIQPVGNAAATGAKLVLLNRDALEEAERIARQVECVELWNSVLFREKFIQYISFPTET